MGKDTNVVRLNNSNSADTDSKIDIIKNLIFGEQFQSYDEEFEELRKDILKKKNALEDLVEEIRQDLSVAIDNVSTDLHVRMSDLEKSIEGKIDNLDSDKVDKNMLGKLLMDLGHKVSQK